MRTWDSQERENRLDERNKADDGRMQPRPRRPRVVRRDEEEYEGEDERQRFSPRRPINRRGEDEEDAGQRRPRGRNSGGRDEEYDEEYDNEYDEDGERRKAPLLVRFFAWGALLAILFAFGYIGANYFFGWMDKKGGPRVGDVVGNASDVTQQVKEEAQQANVTAEKADYKLYVPDKSDFTLRSIEIEKGRTEQDMSRVLGMYFDSLKELSLMSDAVKTINVFRSGEMLYINMTSDFAASLKKLSAAKASQVITGVVRTMQEDFPPVSTVKFYIDNQEAKDTKPVDLTKEWKLPK